MLGLRKDPAICAASPSVVPPSRPIPVPGLAGVGHPGTAPGTCSPSTSEAEWCKTCLK
jgi:hypothetical protein